MTHLKGNLLVFKDHPRIAFRGWIDALEAEITLAQQAAAGEGCPALAEELEEVLRFVRRYIRFDVLDEPVGEHPAVRLYAGAAAGVFPLRKALRPAPFMIRWAPTGPAFGPSTNCVPLVRQTELAAYAAFRDPDGNVTRSDMILGLNRLSSLMWIMMIKWKAGQYRRQS